MIKIRPCFRCNRTTEFENNTCCECGKRDALSEFAEAQEAFGKIGFSVEDFGKVMHQMRDHAHEMLAPEPPTFLGFDREDWLIGAGIAIGFSVFVWALVLWVFA